MKLGAMGLARWTGPAFHEPQALNRCARLGATSQNLRNTVLALLIVAVPSVLWAQEPHVPLEQAVVNVEQLPAREAVRQGNQLLREGDPHAALEAYEQAKTLRPDAPEVPFVEGLAHYALEEYEDARHNFKKTAAGEVDQLANDALYSIGTTYHAEALKHLQDPELAIEKLEAAMSRYRQVLADYPEHAAARDANLKAASLRRQVKQMLEQQQQQEQQSDQSCDQENEEQQEQQNQQQQEGEQEEDSEQEQQAQASPDDEQQAEPQPAASEDREQQEERVSREQAERQLREMMQAIREREEQRRRQVQKMPIAPVEKDW